MNNILSKIIPINKDNSINVFIEIKKGSKNKYELDKKTGLIKLDRVMASAQVYPFDYGFIPNTLWKDGDPVDVVMLTSHPLNPGIFLEARAIAYLDMIDNGESDIKIIAVPLHDIRFDKVHDLDDINPRALEEITHFFETYKILEHKKVNIPKIYGKDEAMKAIKESIKIFKSKNNKSKK